MNMHINYYLGQRLYEKKKQSRRSSGGSRLSALGSLRHRFSFLEKRGVRSRRVFTLRQKEKRPFRSGIRGGRLLFYGVKLSVCSGASGFALLRERYVSFFHRFRPTSEASSFSASFTYRYSSWGFTRKSLPLSPPVRRTYCMAK